MTAISLSTQRRLRQLPQIPSVWEGDRRYVDRLVEDVELAAGEDRRELILWVDGIAGVVRSMKVVNSTVGIEAIVRTLIEAMEEPQSPSQPARPQKIIVRDRQLQFYLRGVVHDLDIVVEYVPELPIVNELFDRFADLAGIRAPRLPRKYLERLKAVAREIWTLAPWSLLTDREAISIALNDWDIEKFYVSVMGMLGMEYGILLYRSAESLLRFRELALHEAGIQDMESAFLAQDCIFVTFDAIDAGATDPSTLPASAIAPSFGNIHPLEGMRPFLYEVEAIATQVALTAFKEFVEAFKTQLQAEELPDLSAQIQVVAPDTNAPTQITVATVPGLSQELLQIHLAVEREEAECDLQELPIRADLIPRESMLMLEIMPWERVEQLRLADMYHQTSDVKPVGVGLPLLIVQTTRPKAIELLQRIQQAGGLRGIYINFGTDRFAEGGNPELGLLQLADGNIQLFGDQSAVKITDWKKWERSLKKSQGYCAVIVAQGLTGKARGNPGLREILASIETQYLAEADLPFGTLQLMPLLSLLE